MCFASGRWTRKRRRGGEGKERMGRGRRERWEGERVKEFIKKGKARETGSGRKNKDARVPIENKMLRGESPRTCVYERLKQSIERALLLY